MKVIDPSKAWFSAQELAGLPGMAKTDSGVMREAKKNLWSSRGQLRGKGVEYEKSALPEITRLHLAVLVISAPPASSEVEGSSNRSDTVGADIAATSRSGPFLPYSQSPLNHDQLESEMARETLLEFIASFEGPQVRAMDFLNAGYHAKTLPDPLMRAMGRAWWKRRNDCRLTRETLNQWRRVKRNRGRSAPGKRQPDMEVKPWYPLALILKQRPQGSCLKWITDQIEENWKRDWGNEPPSYDTVRRFFAEKFSQIDQMKGRHTGSALAAHSNYVSRTSVGMAPWQEIHADGWNTHFTAPHPVTGEYVTYEVWHAHDVATRFVPPFSIGQTETFEVIAKCVENAVREGGVMAILQTDSTKVVKNSARFKTDPTIALADRVGFTVLHPQTVGNSQANGIAENFNAWLDRESRELATYQAKSMDSLTLKKVKKLTEKAVREQKKGNYNGYADALLEAARTGKGHVLRSYGEACAWLEEKRQKWNAKPHKSLPKIRDKESGRLRHQSPNEALGAALDEGWKPALLREEYIVMLFRPHIKVTVRREAVSPYGGMRYHHPVLGDWNGQTVVVAYDIMDWHRIWVKTPEGELICEAEFKEAPGYRTQSAQEAAEEKRALSQIKHRERQINIIRERVGLNVIESEAVQVSSVSIPAVSPEALPPMNEQSERHEPTVMNWQETVMWLYGDKVQDDGENLPSEAAAE